jgi:triacylglycerol lipase
MPKRKKPGAEKSTSPQSGNGAPPAFDPQATNFSAANALLLAKLSNAAYLDEQPARDAVKQLGLTGFIWIDLTEYFTDVYAIALGGPGFVVIAFRGTKSFDDWMTDLKATPVGFPWIFAGGPDVGDIHAGFGHALVDAWNRINSAISNLIPTPDIAPDMPQQPTLWLTGHSLGGALAVLAGAALSMWAGAPIRSVSGIYTFGQPRVGLFRFCGNYDHLLRDRTFRFVNNQDLVPRVPFRGWDYADLGQLIHFDQNGSPQLQSSQWTSFLSRTLESFGQFFDIAGHAQGDIRDHSMNGYEELVAQNAATLDQLFT